MNKTININLAGTFFHIDEDAFQKLQRYLEAIKNSLTTTQGQTEILADIEARIAELFGERVIHERQVVSLNEVEEIINIMGQPEDYIVDEEIFDDEPTGNPNNTNNNSSRKLFRDTGNAYIGGVSSGLAYYFGVDPLWIRILWVFLFFGFGTGILLYILLWILMPAAKTTADKLAMSGKPINISNIEEKVKEGFSNVKGSFDDVADRISNANYDDVNQKVKDKSRSFFDTLRKIIKFIFTIFSKKLSILIALLLLITNYCLSQPNIPVPSKNIILHEKPKTHTEQHANKNICAICQVANFRMYMHIHLICLYFEETKSKMKLVQGMQSKAIY